MTNAAAVFAVQLVAGFADIRIGVKCHAVRVRAAAARVPGACTEAANRGKRVLQEVHYVWSDAGLGAGAE